MISWFEIEKDYEIVHNYTNHKRKKLMHLTMYLEFLFV